MHEVAAALAGIIRPGDRVVVGQACAEPQTLAEALADVHAMVGPFETFVGPIFTRSYERAAEAGMRFLSYGAMGWGAKLARAGLLDLLPAHYGQLETIFASAAVRADVALLQLARSPDGRLGASIANDYTIAAASRARAVVAEVNSQAPWCVGGELPDDFRIDLLIETDRAPAQAPAAENGPVEAAIGAHVGALVPDGATLQIGIGIIPDAVLAALSGHRDLGIHSGLISDGVVDLVERGAITGARKTVDAGITVSNTTFGSRRLYDFVDGNRSVRLAPALYTHNPRLIAMQPSMMAINSVIEVDLAGNINAEVADGAAIGGTGGLLDFSRAALQSEGGRAIVALRSTDRTGSLSRIVPRVAPVTVPKTDADTIVTEHGSACLRNLSLKERARALIAIADPRHRDELQAAFEGKNR